MSLPPSTIGLFQEIVTAFLLTLSISGFEGGPGGPAKKREEVKEKKIVLSIYLYIYIYLFVWVFQSKKCYFLLYVVKYEKLTKAINHFNWSRLCCITNAILIDS